MAGAGKQLVWKYGSLAWWRPGGLVNLPHSLSLSLSHTLSLSLSHTLSLSHIPSLTHSLSLSLILCRVLSALGVVAEQPQLIEDIIITKKVNYINTTI